MNDEIKEIKIIKSIHAITIVKNGVIVKEQFGIDDEILDYITNLQQENERLKDIVLEKDSQIKEMILQKTDYTTVNILEMKLEDYKSRVEKASSLIEPLVEWGECTINGKILKCVYDILNGRSDE